MAYIYIEDWGLTLSSLKMVTCSEKSVSEIIHTGRWGPSVVPTNNSRAPLKDQPKNT